MRNIHALCGIRTQDPGFQASEDSTCLRPLGYHDRLRRLYKVNKVPVLKALHHEDVRGEAVLTYDFLTSELVAGGE
jgi:hypothetical protein